MSFETITKTYLANFQASCRVAYSNGAKAIELATRPAVHQYIQSLVSLCKKDADDILLHHDVNYTKRDRPDWRLEDRNTYGIYCFGDHKSLSMDKPLKLSANEEKQIERYLELGRPVFVFDGIEFLFFFDGIKSPARCELVKKPLVLSDKWDQLIINPLAEQNFRKLINNPGFRKWTETQLIEQLAIRARDLSDDLNILLCAPVGSGASISEESLLKALHNLKLLISKHHDTSLANNDACADFISQVLTFGLFYAHTRHGQASDDPVERRLAIADFWNECGHESRLRPFKSIIYELSEPLKDINVLSQWYAEILGVLAHAEYMGTEKGPQDFHALFEKFLSKFDAKTRFDRGAFYTPSVLSNWVAQFTEKLSTEVFSVSLLNSANKIIDPCCGTGSFLEAICNLGTTGTALDSNLIGLEILPAPYALAHYRMSEVKNSNGYELNLKILLTDTLSDNLAKESSFEDNGFSAEHTDASECCKAPIRVVIGNPPSSNHPASSAPRTIIEKLISDFRPPKAERSDRQNIQKALSNEAYKFLRWSCDKVINSAQGIVALVLPGSFARSVSLQYARKWILENFSAVYLLEIDGDARTNDATQSIFSVLQGRLVLFGVKTAIATSTCKIYHLDITAKSKQEKIKFLADCTGPLSFTEIVPSYDTWTFAPSTNYPKDKWGTCWPLTTTDLHQGIFSYKCSAVKLAPTAMLFHTSKNILLRRSSELGRKASSKSEIEKWFNGQRKKPSLDKLTVLVKESLCDAVKNDSISKYHFRPFVEGWVADSDKLFSALGSAPGAGTRARPEIRKAFSEGAIGISLAPSPVDLGATLTRFACFSWALPDNDVAARGNAMVYCDKFPVKNTKNEFVLQSNICSAMLQLFSFSEDSAKNFIFYAYAVLSSQIYLDTFEGILYGSSNPKSPVRVPISNTLETRKTLSNFGEKIALCERAEFHAPVVEGITMSENDMNNFRLAGYDYQDASKTLILTSDEKSVLTITGINAEVYNLRISGHNVVEKWLRERTFPYLRRTINEGDIEALIQLVSNISLQLSLLDEVNIIVDEMLSTNDLVDVVETQRA